MATNDKEVPPLSLIPEDEVLSEDQKDSAKYCSFKLFTLPASAAGTNGNMSKYSFTMMKVDGTQSIHQHILWAQKKLKASKSGMSGSSNPAKKQWKSKSEYAKDKAKKELNALKKKAKKVKKELNSISRKVSKAKKRKEPESKAAESDDDSNLFQSLNALKEGLRDIDAVLNVLEFSSDEDGEVNSKN
jgi:phenylalanyl-tRNA synthetase alpha subunit